MAFRAFEMGGLSVLFVAKRNWLANICCYRLILRQRAKG
jgi:hypothetical protein